MKVHEKKIWPRFYKMVISGDKNYEIREDDCNYQVDDFLVLREWDPGSGDYTGNYINTRITSKVSHEDFPAGIVKGYCVLGIRIIINPSDDKIE